MASRKRTTKKRRAVDRQVLEYEKHLRGLIALSSDWYWEQDSHYRFTQFTGAALQKNKIDPRHMLGTRRWDHGGTPLGDGGSWDAHKATLEARKSFTDFIYHYTDTRGNQRFLSVCGQPVFDARKRFKGYYGSAKDVTERIHTQRRVSIEHAVTRMLAESGNITDAAERIIRMICETLGWVCGTLWKKEQGGTIRCIESWGIESDHVSEFLAASERLTLPADPVYLVKQILANAEPVWIKDVTKEPKFIRMSAAMKAGLRSAFAFPIKVGERLTGAMEFFSSDIHQPDAELLNCVSYVGIQIGQFCERVEAQERLRESEARFRSLTELSSDWYWEQDEQFRFTFFSGLLENKTGYNVNTLIGTRRWDKPRPNLTEADWARHKAQLERHEPFYDFEMCQVGADGSENWAAVSGIPVFDAAGCFKGYRGVGRDITIRKRAEQALRESEARFRSLTELSADWYWEQDEHFRFTLFSGDLRGTKDETDLGSNALLGKHRWDLPRLNLTDADWARHKALLERHEPFYDFEMCHRKKDGTLSWCSVSGSPMFDDAGRFKGYRGMGKDITARKVAEEALRASEARFRDLIEFSSDWYWEQDANYRFTILTDRDMPLGLSRKGMLGHTRWEQETDLTEAQWAAHRADLDAHRAFRDFVIRITKPDGEQRYIKISGKPVYDENGTFVGYRGVSSDITSQKLDEDALRRSEARFRDLTALSSDWYWEQDENFRFTYFSGAFQRKNGFVADNYIGKMRWDQPTLNLTEEDWARHKAQLERHEPFYDLEICRRQSDGRLSWGAVSGMPIFDADGRFQGYRGVGKDITARKLAEQELRESEARFRDLTELSSDWYWEQDENFRLIHREGVALERSAFRVLKDEGKARWELDYIDVTEAQWAEHKATLMAHKTFHNLVLKRKDGNGVLRYVSLSGRPIFDDKGTFKGYRGIGRDVTDQQRRQEELLRFRAVIDATADAIHIVDPDTMTLIDVNETACRHLGYTRDEFLRMEITRFAPLYDRDKMGKVYDRLFSGDDAEQRAEIIHRRKDGSIVPIEIHRRGIVLEGRRIVVNVMHDITERKRAEAVLRESEARFRSLTELSSDWYWQQDDQFRFVQVSGGALHKTGLREEEFLGKTPWDPFFRIELQPLEWDAHRATLQARQPFRDFTYRWALPNGGVAFYTISGQPYYDDSGKFMGYRGVGRDVTERMLSQERIQYLATHDNLTGLPNRVMFTEMLNNAIATAKRYERSFALLFLDLDRFKNINDTFGHEIGDLLLKEMTERLRDTLRDSDVVARLGGDEFVILLQETGDQNHVAMVARKVLAALSKPVVLLGQECRVSASIGICIYPNDAQDEQSLMKNADIAMYRAKEEGRNNFQFYSQHINVHTLERLALEANLRHALDRGQLSLHYQAKLDLRTGAIAGVEALLRWQQPDIGMVSPAQFIPLAEETGLIVPIGKWVLKTACAQNVAWQRQGLAPLCIAVNLSPRQFSDDDLLKDITSTLQETGMDPGLLELELTEGMVMQSPERAAAILHKIKALGVRLAIDDFGVGYSSLAHIKRFPFDIIKIDRSFIRDIPHDAEDNAITETIIAMGRTLSLTVVAEGVETEAQQRFLIEHACDEMQGFYFNKPAPADRFAEFVCQYVAVQRLKRSNTAS